MYYCLKIWKTGCIATIEKENSEGIGNIVAIRSLYRFKISKILFDETPIRSCCNTF